MNCEWKNKIKEHIYNTINYNQQQCDTWRKYKKLLNFIYSYINYINKYR